MSLGPFRRSMMMCARGSKEIAKKFSGMLWNPSEKKQLRDIAQLRNVAISEVTVPLKDIVLACMKLDKSRRPKFYEVVGKLLELREGTFSTY